MTYLENKITNSASASLMIALLWIFFTGCHQNVRTDVDTPERGTIHISVDETFKPVIDSEIQVFEALYPQAKVIADYKPEAECFKDLMKDSTKMIIVTRGLTPQEEKYYKDKFSFSPTWSKVANDAIAVIVNKNATDSLFTMSEIRGILEGTTGDKQV
ncbi:MAG: substrate-binding domain-containing protein, partial [Ginsengibacter sp.]